jgi:hypothetical protein
VKKIAPLLLNNAAFCCSGEHVEDPPVVQKVKKKKNNDVNGYGASFCLFFVWFGSFRLGFAIMVRFEFSCRRSCCVFVVRR